MRGCSCPQHLCAPCQGPLRRHHLPPWGCRTCQACCGRLCQMLLATPWPPSSCPGPATPPRPCRPGPRLQSPSNLVRSSSGKSCLPRSLVCRSPGRSQGHLCRVLLATPLPLSSCPGTATPPRQCGPGPRLQRQGSLVQSSSRKSCLPPVCSLVRTSPGRSQGPGSQRLRQAHQAVVCCPRLTLCQETSCAPRMSARSAWPPCAASCWHPVATCPTALSAQSDCVGLRALMHMTGDACAPSARSQFMPLSPGHSTKCWTADCASD